MVFADHTRLHFSSPEPLAHGELLWSLDVRRASSVINNCFKGHILLNYCWILTKLGRNYPYMALLKNSPKWFQSIAYPGHIG